MMEWVGIVFLILITAGHVWCSSNSEYMLVQGFCTSYLLVAILSGAMRKREGE